MEASEFYCDGAYCDLKFVYDDRSGGNADDELTSLGLLEDLRKKDLRECHRRTRNDFATMTLRALNMKDYRMSFREIIETRDRDIENISSSVSFATNQSATNKS